MVDCCSYGFLPVLQHCDQPCGT